jgi:hypothetical protein
MSVKRMCTGLSPAALRWVWSDGCAEQMVEARNDAEWAGENFNLHLELIAT